MKRSSISNVSAVVLLTMLVGLAVITFDCSFAVADNTKTHGNNANTDTQTNGNSANANSTKKPGANCDKLNAVTQEYKDCIKAQSQIQNNTNNKKTQTTTGN
jgi:hypothetical protein